MRSRNIKPSLFKNEILGVEDPLLTIVFQGLWCAADREGLVEDRPLRLKAEILPYRENIDFNGYLTVLSRLEFIRRYEFDGIKVIEVLNFKKHQNPHKTEKESELPKYIENSNRCLLTVNTPLKDDGLTEPARLIPDSLLLIPDKNIQKGKKFDPLAFCPDFIPEKLWLSFIENRKFKKLQNSELALTTACNQFREATKRGYSIEDCIGAFCEGKWTRFKAEWMDNIKKNQSSRNQIVDEKAERARYLLGGMRDDEEGHRGMGLSVGSDDAGTEIKRTAIGHNSGLH